MSNNEKKKDEYDDLLRDIPFEESRSKLIQEIAIILKRAKEREEQKGDQDQKK